MSPGRKGSRRGNEGRGGEAGKETKALRLRANRRKGVDRRVVRVHPSASFKSLFPLQLTPRTAGGFLFRLPPSPVCLPPVEQPDGLALCVRCEVRVPERHLDALVPEQLLDGLERGAAHHEVTCEGMTECMTEPVRRDALRELGAPARVRDDVLTCFHSGTAARRKRSASSNERNSSSLTKSRLMGNACTRGARSRTSHSTARLTRFRSPVRWLLIDFFTRPEAQRVAR